MSTHSESHPPGQEGPKITNREDQSVETLVELCSELVGQFDEAVRLLEPMRQPPRHAESTPLVFMIPGEEEDGETTPAATLIIPAGAYLAGMAEGSVDIEALENIFKKIGKSLKKINWGKVANVVGGVVQGGLGGLAGGLPGIIMGAAKGGLGSIGGGSARPAAPPPQIPYTPGPNTGYVPGAPPMYPSPAVRQPAQAGLSQADLNQLVQLLLPLLLQALGRRESVDSVDHIQAYPDGYTVETRQAQVVAAAHAASHENDDEHDQESAVLEFLTEIRHARGLLHSVLPGHEDIE